ncbi:Hypothetical protein HDN1F_37700 [gamma proteobacterium HdN1]|nr:Hypothetical protein HDN1F_37700 [gamma proteobacterium HdN1]
MNWRPLKAFHSLPREWAEVTIDAALTPSADGFYLSFRLAGEGVAACLPALSEHSMPIGGQRRDELWKQTCLEAFFGVRGQTAYYEFNASPEGDWALYRFDGYRTQMTAVALSRPPELLRQQWQFNSVDSAASKASTLLIEWWIPTFGAEALSDVSITAVLAPWPRAPHSDLAAKPERQLISYWALEHAGSVPDFHRRESFVIALDDAIAALSDAHPVHP